MSERPTPETDALILSKAGFGPTDWEWRQHSRRLERERDEAREDLEFRRGLYKVLEEANNRLIAANEEAVKLAQTLKQERDEARKYLKWIHDVADSQRKWNFRTLAKEGLMKSEAAK